MAPRIPVFTQSVIGTIVALLLLAGVACGPAGYPSRSRLMPSPSNWGDINVGDAFSVRMPARPDISETSENDFDGTVIHSKVGKLMTSNGLIGFAVQSAAGGFIQDPYERASSVAADEDNEWKLRWENEYEQNGFQTADRIIDNEEGISIRLHFVRGQSKMYTLFAVYATEREKESKWWVSAFLEGARFPATQALAPVGDGILNEKQWTFAFPPLRAFAAEFPGRPSSYGASKAPKKGTTHTYGVSTKGSGFQVLVHEYSDELPADILKTIRDSRAQGYELEEQHYIHRRGYPGVDVTLQSKSQVLRAQYFVTAQRVYEVLAWSPASDGSTHSSTSNRFLQSFRIF